MKFKEYKEVENIKGWAKMYYGYKFYDLDRHDSIMLMAYLIDTQFEGNHRLKCNKEGCEDYYMYLNRDIQGYFPQLSPKIIRNMFTDLVKHDYISMCYDDGVRVTADEIDNRVRFVKLNYEKISQALGCDLSCNESCNESCDFSGDFSCDFSGDESGDFSGDFSGDKRSHLNRITKEQINTKTDYHNIDIYTEAKASDVPLSIEKENNNSSSNVSIEKEVKHKYGEYNHVLLTDKQYADLTRDYSESILGEHIKSVDEYCERTGKRYKNYNLTIRHWFPLNQRLKSTQDEVRSISYDLSIDEIATDENENPLLF